MSTIACGVDGSPQARHAAIVARALAQRLGARLRLVYVRSTPRLIGAESVVAGARTASQRSIELARYEAQEAFERLAPDITPANADRELRLGQPAAELAAAAADCDAEILVVGSRGRGAWRSAALGSVSVAVAKLAPCPVIIVPSAQPATRDSACAPSRRVPPMTLATTAKCIRAPIGTRPAGRDHRLQTLSRRIG